MLSGTDSNGKISYEMVFGASNIIGDIKDAIDNAFEEIERIEKHGNKDIKMVEKHPTPEKVEAIKDALKHFEVI